MAATNLISLTTAQRARLYQGQPGTAQGTVYTVPAATDVKIGSLVLCNTTGTAATITVCVVPAGGTAGSTNRILSAFSVAANDTVIVETPIVMTAGDFISVSQGTAAAITATISGETYA